MNLVGFILLAVLAALFVFAPRIGLGRMRTLDASQAQKELLLEFEKLSEENNPESSGFLKKMKSFWESMKS